MDDESAPPSAPEPVLPPEEGGDSRDVLRADLEDLLRDGPVCLIGKRSSATQGKRSLFARKFSDAEEAAEHVRRAGEEHDDLNFYVVRNPSGPDLFRKDESGARYAVARGEMGNPPWVVDLTELRWVPIDLDPTTDDHEQARADALAAIDALDIPLWFVMDSGRGIQAQVHLATGAENTPENVDLFKRCAKALYKRLEAHAGAFEVDTVQNPNRQSRLVDTVNRKTDRVARLLRHDRLEVPCLNALADLLGVDPTAPATRGASGAIGDEHVDEKLDQLGWDPPRACREILKALAGAAPDLDALSPQGLELVESRPPRPHDPSVDSSDEEVVLARELLEAGEAIAGVLGALAQDGRHCARQSNAARAMARCVTTALRGSALDTLVVSKATPYKTASLFLRTTAPHLKHQSDDWLHYDGAAYVELEDATVRSRVYDLLERARSRVKDGDEWKLVPFNPDTTKVNQVVDALRARAHLPRDLHEPPCWLSDPGPPASEIVACRNGLLHLPERRLLPPTPAFFTRNALQFDHDPSAVAAEQWQQFLEELWPDDPETLGLVQEMFGYVLVPDTRLQKAFLMVGPPRSGKGTIGRVLTALVGQRNTCAPTLDSLSRDFGLQPLIGKQLAIVSDLRLGSRTDHAAIAENLLRITGEDLVTVNRKYKREWSGRLATRFVIMTNEVPRFIDASGALANRFVPVGMERSFLGKEDVGLGDRLLQELPAILNWAIDGFLRLRARGHFRLPSSSTELIQDLADAASPVRAFVRSMCVLDPSATTPKSVLYADFKRWCEDNGYHPGSVDTFGRQLKAATDGRVRATKPRGQDGNRVPSYAGISLIPYEPKPEPETPF